MCKIFNLKHGGLWRVVYISRYVRIKKYWTKVVQTENIIIKSLYDVMMKQMKKGVINWASKVKYLLDTYGFTYVWNAQNSINHDYFLNTFKKRLVDDFIQKWHVSVNNSKSLVLYRNVKTLFSYEPYFNLLPHKYRNALVKIRLSAHQLKIETGM